MDAGRDYDSEHDLAWPELPYAEWRDTCETLHLWTQIVGKIRVARSPWVNHSWHVPLYLTARGLTTSPIPHGRRTFQIDFDFQDHVLEVAASDGTKGALELRPRSVADIHHALMLELERMALPVTIHGSPNEIENPIPFAEDERHGAYDAEYANRFWRALSSGARILNDFRADFIGKCSPVHFFWGSFDLAVSRFSGEPAPPHPGGIPNLPDWIGREAYSHALSSAGFWPGGGRHPHAAFYSYAWPPPAGLSERRVKPPSAYWEEALGEFLLPYEAVRTSPTGEDDLMDFLRTTYEAAADLAGWDRARLEWPLGARPDAPQRPAASSGRAPGPQTR